MKIVRYIYAAWFLLLSGAAFLPAALVVESDSEFTTAGDLDGDGHGDVVIVDKATAAYRVGFGTPAGHLTWEGPFSTGMESVRGFSCGRVHHTTRDALVFSSPYANRVNVVEPSPGAASPLTDPLYVSSLGPDLVVAAPVEPSGGMAYHGLFVSTILDDSDALHKLSNSNGSPTEASVLLDDAGWYRGTRFTVEAGEPEGVTALYRASAADLVLRMVDLLSGGITFVSSPPLAPGTEYTVGQFGGTSLATFLHHVPGSNTVSSVQVVKGSGYTFGPATGHVFTHPVDRLCVISGGTSNIVVATHSAGHKATLYAFDGSSFTALQTLQPTAQGTVISGIIPVSGDDFVMLTRGSNDVVSTGHDALRFNAGLGIFEPLATGDLPDMRTHDARANVIVFEREPLVDPNPGKLAAYAVRDWSTVSSLPIGGPVLRVAHDTDGGPSAGLSAGSTVDFPLPVGATTGLVNQFHASVSIQMQEAATGEQRVWANVSPPGGLYRQAVQVSFTNPPGTFVRYRFSSVKNAKWTLYADPFWVFEERRLLFYAQATLPDSGGSYAKSDIQSVRYRFERPASELDSDGDGVPDYVEIDYGLDPVNSGDDSDGDGFSDLDELLQNTDPGNTNSVPDFRFDRAGAFDLHLSVFGYDGIHQANAFAAYGTPVSAFALGGGMVGSAPVAPHWRVLPLTLFVESRMTELSSDLAPVFLSIGTVPHFKLMITPPDTDIGRDLVKLFPVPQSPPVDPGYEYGGVELHEEATNWVAYARDAYLHVDNVVQESITFADAVPALLMERKCGDMLDDRSVVTDRMISLFPFRPGDTVLPQPSAAALSALERLGPGGEPAMLLGSAFDAITNSLVSATNLTALAREVYRISSVYHNASNGLYRLPVDVLRSFILSNTIDTAYIDQFTLPPGQLGQAIAEAQGILAGLPPRPVATFDMVVRTGSFTGEAPRLWTTPDSVAKELYDDRREPFAFPEGFDLVPGVELSVEAFTDLGAAGDGTARIEVITISVVAIPAAGSGDEDHNLIPDALEMMLYGTTGASTGWDADLDGFPDLQEFLEGTDPQYAGSAPSGVDPYDLGILHIELVALSSGEMQLVCDFPSRYVDFFEYTLVTTDDLGFPFTFDSTLPSGTLQKVVPAPVAKRFYRITYRLR